MRRLAERAVWMATAVLTGVCVWLVAARVRAPRPAALDETTKVAALDSVPRATDPGPYPEWLREHFAWPPQGQGPQPAWTPIELRLDAEACGACHVTQYEDWKGSWHAGAMGPGVTGQLRDGPEVADELKCARCHAPLAEQRLSGDQAEVAPNGHALATEGISCAGCHVRAYTRYGPPAETPAAADAPHGGFVERDAFGDSRFCESCHDFAPGQRALEGKLLQETWQEWLRTSYARDGVTCQDCHMPDGRHLWRGVHDPEMVRSALSAEATWARIGDRLTGTLTVTNTGAGHRLPTYTTPELTLRMEQLDADGNVIADTTQQGTIARRIKPDVSAELFDTRLLPGESHALAYDTALSPRATAVRALVSCSPDEGYVRFYTIKLRDPEWAPNGRAEIEAALTRAENSRFTVWQRESELPLPTPADRDGHR